MTPGVVWQLTNHYERGSHESEQAHAHLAARLRHLLPRRRLRHREAGHGFHSQVTPSLPGSCLADSRASKASHSR